MIPKLTTTSRAVDLELGSTPQFGNGPDYLSAIRKLISQRNTYRSQYESCRRTLGYVTKARDACNRERDNLKREVNNLNTQLSNVRSSLTRCYQEKARLTGISARVSKLESTLNEIAKLLKEAGVM